MKTIVQADSDNGSVPPAFYHRYLLSFRNDGTVQLELFDDRGQDKSTGKKTGSYSMSNLERLMKQLAALPSPVPELHKVGGETRQVTDFRPEAPVTYSIAADDPEGIRLFEQFQVLCPPQWAARIRQLFFK